MLQYKVPQNVDVEDKIIGPLTVKQFIQSLIGISIIYILYAVLGPISFTLFMMIALPIVLLFIALAVYKVNDQPFEKFLFALIKYTKRPNIRIWQKETKISDIKIIHTQKEEPKEAEKEEITKSHLDNLAYVLDTRGWTEEHKERQELMQETPKMSPVAAQEIKTPENITETPGEAEIQETPKEKTHIPVPFEDLLPEEPEDMYEHYSNKM